MTASKKLLNTIFNFVCKQIRDASQTAAHQLHNNILRQRLQNYPMSQLYQTQVIDFPGSANSGQQQHQQQQQPIYMQVQQQPNYMQVQPQPQPNYMQVQPQPNWVHTQTQPNYVQSQVQPNYVQTKPKQKYFPSQPTINTEIDYQPNYQQDYRPAPQSVPEYQQTVQTQPIITTTSTTPEPVVITEQEEVSAPLPVPAVRAPIRPPVRRVRHFTIFILVSSV